MYLQRNLISLDGAAGLVAGVLVLLFHPWLSEWYSLPRHLLLFSGIANLLYGSYSTALSRRPQRPIQFIVFLAFANACWALVCFGLTAYYWSATNILGRGHFIVEGIFVGTLALFEWHWREELQNA